MSSDHKPRARRPELVHDSPVELEAWQWVCLLSALVVVAWWAHLRFWTARLDDRLVYDELIRVPTPDGCAVELRRLVPPDGADGADGAGAGAGGADAPPRPPVLLVHGIAANHRNVDARKDRSLARTIRDAGRDVWLLTLRSGRADLSFVERRRTTFATMATNDLPVGVEEVLRRTGASALDYVGFSMGGMLLYAAIGRGVSAASVRRVAIIGSPGRVIRPFGFLRIAGILPRALVPPLPLRFWARTGAFVADLIPTPFHRLVYNPDNVERGSAGGALVNIIESIPGPLAADFGDWLGNDGELLVDGERALDALGGLTIPALFLAGAADRIAPPRAVKEAADAWGCDAGAEVIYRELSEAAGSADYGHGDLAVGIHVDRDVYQPVVRFLS